MNICIIIRLNSWNKNSKRKKRVLHNHFYDFVAPSFEKNEFYDIVDIIGKNNVTQKHVDERIKHYESEQIKYTVTIVDIWKKGLESFKPFFVILQTNITVEFSDTPTMLLVVAGHDNFNGVTCDAIACDSWCHQVLHLVGFNNFADRKFFLDFINHLFSSRTSHFNRPFKKYVV